MSGEYVETLAGKTHTFTQRSVRYVRDYLNGSTANSGNHWTEIEVWGTATTAYVGDYFEWNGSVETMTRYYSAGGTRVAVRHSNGDGTNGLVYLLGDHLGSTSITADPLDGDKLSEVRYKAWGETRHSQTNAPTDRRYTGQTSEEAVIGLYYYGARFYDSALGRFVSPDSIIPGTENPLAWDRYAYTFNNPVKYNDPSGHCPWCVVGALVGAAVGYGAQVYNNYQNGVTGSAAWTQNISAEPIVGGALIGAGAVIFAPAVVAAAGDVLAGVGVATGSTALFGVGMSAYGASSTLSTAIAGQTVAKSAAGNNPLAGVTYSDRVKVQATQSDYHGFPEHVSAFGADGAVYTQSGADGGIYTHVEIAGGYKNEEGVFHYIINSANEVTHRLFEAAR